MSNNQKKTNIPPRPSRPTPANVPPSRKTNIPTIPNPPPPPKKK